VAGRRGYTAGVVLEKLSAADEPAPDVERITALLRAFGQGDRAVLEDLMTLVYAHLRRMARGQLARERAGHTLDSVALVSEAFLRLQGDGPRTWENRAHFYGVAAGVMRRILVDHARARNADKRGGGRRPVPLDEDVRAAAVANLGGATLLSPSPVSFETPAGILALDAALEKLAKIDGEASRVVELRFFTGATENEAAMAMNLAPATARRRWAFAKAWLQRTLGAEVDTGV